MSHARLSRFCVVSILLLLATLSNGAKDVVRVWNMGAANVPPFIASYLCPKVVFETFPLSDKANATVKLEYETVYNAAAVAIDGTKMAAVANRMCDTINGGKNKVRLGLTTMSADTAKPALQLCGPLGVPILIAVGTTDLSNKVAYPYGVQVMANDLSNGKALGHLLNHYGWKRVGVLALTAPETQSVLQGLSNVALQKGITLVVQSVSAFDNIRAASLLQLASLKAQGLRIIALCVTNNEIVGVLQAMVDLGMDKAPYQIVGIWNWLRRIDAAWTDPMLKNTDVVRGMLGVFNGAFNSAIFEQQRGWWNRSSVNAIVDSRNIASTAANHFDYNVIARNALNEFYEIKNYYCDGFNFNVSDPAFTSQTGFDPRCFQYARMGEDAFFYAVLKNQTYDGSSGRMAFDTTTGVLLPQFSIVNDDRSVSGVNTLVVKGEVNGDTGVVKLLTNSPVWFKASGSTVVPPDREKLQAGTGIDKLWDGPGIVLAFAVAALSSWVCSILVEQLIFYYMARGKWMMWLILAMLALCAGSWASLLVGVTSIGLKNPLGGTLTTSFDRATVFLSLVPMLPMWTAALYLTIRRPRRQFLEDIVQSLSKASSKKARSPFRCSQIVRMVVAGTLGAAGTMASHYVATLSLRAPCDEKYSFGFSLAGAVCCVVLSTIGLFLYFHLRRSKLRYLSNFIMAGAVCCVHFVTNEGLAFTYNAKDDVELVGTLYDPDLHNGTFEGITVRLLASISFAVLAFVFVGLNVIRLRLSRDTFEQQVREMQRQVEGCKNEIEYLKRLSDHQTMCMDMVHVMRPPSVTRSDHFIFDMLKAFQARDAAQIKAGERAARQHGDQQESVLESVTVSSSNSDKEEKALALTDRTDKTPLVTGRSSGVELSGSASRYSHIHTPASSSAPSTGVTPSVSTSTIKGGSSMLYTSSPVPSASTVTGGGSGSTSGSGSARGSARQRAEEKDALTYANAMVHPVTLEFIKDEGEKLKCNESTAFLNDVALFKWASNALKQDASYGFDMMGIVNNIYLAYLTADSAHQVNVSFDALARIEKKVKALVEEKQAYDAKKASIAASAVREGVTDANTLNRPAPAALDSKAAKLDAPDELPPFNVPTDFFKEIESEVNRLTVENIWSSFAATPAYQVAKLIATQLPAQLQRVNRKHSLFMDLEGSVMTKSSSNSDDTEKKKDG